MTGKIVGNKQFTMNDAWTYGTLVSGGVDGDVGATPNLFEVAGKPVVGVGDKPGTYYVLDRMTGDEVWKAKLTDGSGFQGGVMAPAAVANGSVYVVSNNGTRSSTVFALRSEDGMQQWKHDITDPTFGGPAYGNGVLYVGDQAGNIYALAAADGGELWKTSVPQRRGGGFSLVDGMLFTGYGMHFSDSRMEPLTGGLVMYSLYGQGMVTGPAMTSDCVAGTRRDCCAHVQQCLSRCAVRGRLREGLPRQLRRRDAQHQHQSVRLPSAGRRRCARPCLRSKRPKARRADGPDGQRALLEARRHSQLRHVHAARRHGCQYPDHSRDAHRSTRVDRSRRAQRLSSAAE
jgi:hypothetical protein